MYKVYITQRSLRKCEVISAKNAYEALKQAQALYPFAVSIEVKPS